MNSLQIKIRISYELAIYNSVQYQGKPIPPVCILKNRCMISKPQERFLINEYTII